MADRTVNGTPQTPDNASGGGNAPPMQNAKGYSGDVAYDQLCHLHQQSVRLNKQMAELSEISRNMLQVQMAQSKTLESINDRLKLLENLTTINENIELSTKELDKLEDVMREHAEDQRKNTDLFVETSHAMIEAFNGTDKEEAVEKGVERAKEKRAEADNSKK